MTNPSVNQPQPFPNDMHRDRGYDPKFDFTEAQLNAAAEVIRTRKDGPVSPSDNVQWSRETFQAALKAACKARDMKVDDAGNVRPTPQTSPAQKAV